jgi:lysozyme family protein
MKETYQDAMTRVYQDEGGYSNDPGDAGGPTMYGITIWDARKYWKPNATAADVKAMPKSVAAEIYEQHYAHPLAYDQLPAGVDYAVLDYGINSGISRSTKVLQRIVGVPVDGIMGPATISATNSANPVNLINAIYDERIAFLKRLGKPQFMKGWMSRCNRGRKLALDLHAKYPAKPTSGAHTKTAGAVIAAGGTATAIAADHPRIWPWILAGTIIVAIISYFVVKHFKGKPNVA